jgi:glycosyltransferase involved in cell wall biosynthesis
MDAIVVPGERARIYARHLGFTDRNIFTGLYGIDFDAFAPLFERRAAGMWPRSFLFTGRYAEEKAIDVLVKAYAIYRKKAEQPWPLMTVGQGPMKRLLEGQEGLHDLGFRQPAELHEVMLRTGVAILPSRFDAWPLALVESCAAGLPVIASDACGSAVECVRDGYNGLIVPSDDVAALSEAMLAMHRNYERLAEMGARSRELARPYAAEFWARRWRDIAAALMR